MCRAPAYFVEAALEEKLHRERLTADVVMDIPAPEEVEEKPLVIAKPSKLEYAADPLFMSATLLAPRPSRVHLAAASRHVTAMVFETQREEESVRAPVQAAPMKVVPGRRRRESPAEAVERAVERSAVSEVEVPVARRRGASGGGGGASRGGKKEVRDRKQSRRGRLEGVIRHKLRRVSKTLKKRIGIPMRIERT